VKKAGKQIEKKQEKTMCRSIIMGVVLTACFARLSAAEWHVAKTGSDAAAGTQAAPFLTIQRAAEAAQPGDTVTVHEGVYRERVNPPRGGTSDKQRITYQSAPGEKVVITGSEIIKQWQKIQEDVWKVVIPNTFFNGFNPYNDVIGGEWCGKPLDGFYRHTGAVYLNGTWLDEANELARVLTLANDLPLWYAEVNTDNTTIWAQFKGVDPNAEKVEINVRQSVFYPSEPGRNFITVRGFTMCQAATPWAGAMSEQVGLIGTHWSKSWNIEDNIISHSMNTGITLGRYDLGRHGIAKLPASGPGFVTSCELALQHGWSRENIGSHVVRNNRISHCEKNGIHGSLGGVFSTIEGNIIHDIALKGWIRGADVAGLKLLAANDTLIRNNHIYRCGGFGGIWLDWMTQGTRVTGNLLHDNGQQRSGFDLMVEVNHGPFMVDNNLFLSSRSIWDLSQGAAYAHNLIAGVIVSEIVVKRQTPYFKPHTLEEMKLSNIKQKDARYYNNLFVGKGSLPKDILVGKGGLPEDVNLGNLQMAGNVRLEGVDVKLEKQEDGLWIKIPPFSSAETREIVTTELLGKAMVPDAPFVQPCGAPYRLDTDYFGKQRNTANPAPGPFENPVGGALRLK
jgi:alpha-N-arabinofuranosidase